MIADQEGRAVIIPNRLYRLIEGRVKASGFSSVDEYVKFVLEEVMDEVNEEESQLLSEDEDEDKEVKKRLKALGYLK